MTMLNSEPIRTTNLWIPHDIIVVHATPLMRIGITSALYESGLFARYSISAFVTLDEADARILTARPGDVIILDIDAWSSLMRPGHASTFHALKTRGLAFGLIASAKQGEVTYLEAQGLSGLVRPESELRHIVSMVEDLAAGRNYFFQRQASAPVVAQLASLSVRQLEILKLMAVGLLNKQIAAELGIKEGTVKCHVSAILKTLDCNRRTQAIAMFILNREVL